MSTTDRLRLERDAARALGEAQDLTRQIAATLNASASQLQTASQQVASQYQSGQQLLNQIPGLLESNQQVLVRMRLTERQGAELTKTMQELTKTLKSPLAPLQPPPQGKNETAMHFIAGWILGLMAALMGAWVWALVTPEPTMSAAGIVHISNRVVEAVKEQQARPQPRR